MDDIFDSLMQDIEQGHSPFFSQNRNTAKTSDMRWSISSG